MTQRLIIAIDVGTTFSGVSYAFQDGSGQQPEIHGVNRYPGAAGEASKIPSQVLYRQSRYTKPYRMGAEVDEFESDASTEALQIKEDCIKVQWFKILLKPGSLDAPSGIKIQLPVGTSPIQVLADYLRYLHECTMKYIQETHMNSESLLEAVGTNVHYVLTHPNGWNFPQQQRIRSAAAKAGLVPKSDDYRLHLLSEGEAAINFCIQRGLTEDLITDTDAVAVIDAGGGTIDISTYRRCPTSAPKGQKMKLEEICKPGCLMEGSIFVTRRAEHYLKKQLKHSKFAGYLNKMCAEFDRKAKTSFRSTQRSSYIEFGTQTDNEPSTGIRSGQVPINGKQMAKFFQPPIEGIVDIFKDMTSSLDGPVVIKRALLVGGFAASEYLFSELKGRLQTLGIQLFRPDRHLVKAVADGAVAHLLNRSVITRVAKYTLGTDCDIRYDENNEDHRKRFETHSYVSKIDGDRWLTGVFRPIIAKGAAVKDTENPVQYSRSFVKHSVDGKFDGVLSAEIIEYKGNLPGVDRQWMDEEPANYETLCEVRCKLRERTLADLQNLPRELGNNSQKYVKCSYDVSLSLGAPELSAQVVLRYQSASKSKPVEVKSAPTIVYHDRDASEDESDSDASGV